MQHVLHLSRGQQLADRPARLTMHLLHAIHAMKHYATDAGPKVSLRMHVEFRASHPTLRRIPVLRSMLSGTAHPAPVLSS